MHWSSQCSLFTFRRCRNLGRTDGGLPHWEHLLLPLGFRPLQTRTGADTHGSGFRERCEQPSQSVGCCFAVCLSVELKTSVCPSARGEAGDRAPAGPGTGGLDTTAGSDWPHGRREAGAGRSSLHTGENAIIMPVSEEYSCRYFTHNSARFYDNHSFSIMCTCVLQIQCISLKADKPLRSLCCTLLFLLL